MDLGETVDGYANCLCCAVLRNSYSLLLLLTQPNRTIPKQKNILFLYHHRVYFQRAIIFLQRYYGEQ
jgi:hypothetical protein